MECSEPGAIRDEELVAYLEGEKVRPAVLKHLARCQRCSAQLTTYRRMELILIKKLYRWDCPSNQVLGEYQLGMLSPEQTAEIKEHLRSCVLCSAEVLALTNFLANDPVLVERAPGAQMDVSVRPSSLNNHHPAREAKRLLDYGREGVRRVIAALVPPQPTLSYQRDPVQQTDVWPRLYSADDVSISVQVERGPNRRGALQLIGFVTRKDAALEVFQGVSVRLSSEAHTVYTQTIDELGNFVFSSIVPATYTLELLLPDGTIAIEQLSIAAQD